MADRRQSAGRRAEDAIRTEMMFDILDWDTSPARAFMSLAEQGAHLNVIFSLWKAGGKLLNDERVWFKASGASCREEWEGVSEIVKAEYIISPDGKWFTHKRVTEQIGKVLSLLKKRREAGAKGGQARVKHMLKQTSVDAQASVKQSSSPILTVPNLTLPDKSKPSAEKQADERHRPLVEFITKCQQHAGVPEQFDGRSAKELSKWLKSNPKVTDDQAKGFIRNFFRSRDRPHGDPPWSWIQYLSSYAEGPHNEFKRVEGGSGNGLGKANQRLKSNLESLHRISLGAAPLGGGDDGGGTLPLASGGDTGANATVLDADVGVESAGSGK